MFLRFLAGISTPIFLYRLCTFLIWTFLCIIVSSLPPCFLNMPLSGIFDRAPVGIVFGFVPENALKNLQLGVNRPSQCPHYHVMAR